MQLRKTLKKVERELQRSEYVKGKNIDDYVFALKSDKHTHVHFSNKKQSLPIVFKILKESGIRVGKQEENSEVKVNQRIDKIRYDIDYYDNLLRRYSATAEHINRIRWDWVSSLHPENVLDYGSGVGWFRAFKPEDVSVDTWDIGPYPQTGILRREYDVVCFWDVLEHTSNWDHIMFATALAKFLVGTVPALPEDKELNTWKHYKPGEHVLHISKEKWEKLFNENGWEVIREGTPECPPREDIWSFVCRRAK